MSFDYFNKLLLKDKFTSLKTSFSEREVPDSKGNISSHSFSDVYQKREKASFSNKVHQTRQLREHKQIIPKKNNPVVQSQHNLIHKKAENIQAENKALLHQGQHLLNQDRGEKQSIRSFYMNFSQTDSENIENQNPQLFFIPQFQDFLNDELYVDKAYSDNPDIEMLPYETFGTDILASFEIIGSEKPKLNDSLITNETPDFYDTLWHENKLERLVERNQSNEQKPLDVAFPKDQVLDIFKKTHSSAQLISDQEGLTSLRVKDLVQPPPLSTQNMIQQMPYFRSMLDESMEINNPRDDVSVEIDDSSDLQTNILSRGKDITSLKAGHTFESDAVKEISGKGNKDASLNFMQEQQQVASTTITENITVIESLLNQMKGRLKKEVDIRNSEIEFDIKHKDLGELSVSLRIQDGAVNALFKGENYEFRNLLRQNLSSISQIFQDLNLECQEHAINIIKK